MLSRLQILLSDILTFFEAIPGRIKRMPKWHKRITITVTSIFMFWLFCFHYTNVHQVGICRNIFTGETWLDDVPGMSITAPWVQVARIDTRPHRVCVECNCKNATCVLVSFDSNGWKEFVEREGFRYYWWSNRFSFNSGHKEEYRGMRDILRGYAFDGHNYSFIKIEKSL